MLQMLSDSSPMLLLSFYLLPRCRRFNMKVARDRDSASINRPLPLGLGLARSENVWPSEKLRPGDSELELEPRPRPPGRRD